jgi:hypothetical protein
MQMDHAGSTAMVSDHRPMMICFASAKVPKSAKPAANAIVASS